MSFWKSTQAFFGFSEEAQELDPFDQELPELPVEIKEDQPVKQPFRGSLISKKPAQSNKGLATEIRIEEPRIYEDSLNIATSLRDNNPVIVNVKYLDTETGKRLIDFVCGTAYAINGHMMKLGETIFLFTPASVLIADTEQKTSLEKGLEQEERQIFFKRAV